MDRFIGSEPSGGESGGGLFKIQYGQIYSTHTVARTSIKSVFKIQYGQIYRYIHLIVSYKFYYLKSNMDRFIA